MTKLAKVGQNIETQNAGWTFDGKVADTFVDHVRQSVPLYEKGHELVCQLSDYFVDKTSVVYELGTSTGELIRKVARHNSHRDGARFIGIGAARQRRRPLCLPVRPKQTEIGIGLRPVPQQVQRQGHPIHGLD